MHIRCDLHITAAPIGVVVGSGNFDSAFFVLTCRHGRFEGAEGGGRGDGVGAVCGADRGNERAAENLRVVAPKSDAPIRGISAFDLDRAAVLGIGRSRNTRGLIGRRAAVCGDVGVRDRKLAAPDRQAVGACVRDGIDLAVGRGDLFA